MSTSFSGPLSNDCPDPMHAFTTQRSSIAKLVSVQAASRPDAIAVADDCTMLSYGDLDTRADMLARQLRNWGVGPEVVVGVCFERSIALVVAELAILKAGGAYLPLEPASPSARMAWQLSDAQVVIVIGGPSTLNRLPEGPWKCLVLDKEGRQEHPEISHVHGEPIETQVSAENLAYLIYTSGSTGEPKAVEVTHAGLSNLLSWHQQTFSVSSNDRATQLANPGFDAAVWELWPYLIAGASVHIPKDAIRNAPDRLRDWIVEHGIAITFVPASLAELLMQMDWPLETKLRFLLTGADTLRHYPPPGLPFNVVNNYGPTECTVVTTSGMVKSHQHTDGEPPIGTPIPNMQVHILDENMCPVPPGFAGELCIAGIGLARGYRNRPSLTAERFVANPFSKEAGSRLYRTGDKGALLPDGQIQFLGRLDDQIKLRGYRIELGEIRCVLDLHPEVERSAVVAREDTPGDKHLVAYFVPEGNSQPTDRVLREFLCSKLPDYMVPESFCRLDAFPLNTNGKIDKKALPPPRREKPIDDQVPSEERKTIEERITAIVAGLLRQETVGLNDNFFELGGNSLLGAQVISRVRGILGVELSLLALFDHPTIAELSELVEQLLVAKIAAMSDEEAQLLVHPPRKTGN